MPLNFIVGLVLFFPAPGWQGMVGFLVSAFVLCYVIGPICLMALRRELPDQKRPFKLPIQGVWSYVAFCIANLIVYWTGWDTFYKMAIAIVIGFIVLAVMRSTKRAKAKALSLDLNHAWWVIGYLVGMVLISFLGSFGGGQRILPEGWDVLVIAIFSLVILLWAYTSRLPAERVTANLGVLLQQEK